MYHLLGANCRGGCVCVGVYQRAYENSIMSSQFCYEPKTILK